MMKKALIYLEFIRPRNIVFGVILLFSGIFIGGKSPWFSFQILLALLSFSLAVAGSLAFNNYVDQDVDKIIHPKRPLPSRRLSPKEGLYFGGSMFAFSFLFALFVNLPFFIMLTLGFSLCLLYELITKNHGIYGNILVAVVIAGVSVTGGFVVNNPYPGFSISLVLFPQLLGGEIIRDVRDVEGDRLKRKTLPMIIDRDVALYMGLYLIATTFFMLPIPYIMHTVGFWYLPSVSIVGFLIVLGIGLTLKNKNNLIITTKITKAAMVLTVFAFFAGSV
jgi:geranylgeranylglycerol-phosphate geranylgeranyltransferase